MLVAQSEGSSIGYFTSLVLKDRPLRDTLMRTSVVDIGTVSDLVDDSISL